MSKNEVIGWLRRYGTSLFLLALIGFFALQNPRFLSIRNLSNILTEVSIYGIIAIGMTFVILTGGVDLAVGSLLAFAGMLGAYVAQAIGAGPAFYWLVALSTAAAAGSLIGYLQGKAATLFTIP